MLLTEVFTQLSVGFRKALGQFGRCLVPLRVPEVLVWMIAPHELSVGPFNLVEAGPGLEFEVGVPLLFSFLLGGDRLPVELATTSPGSLTAAPYDLFFELSVAELG